MSVDFTDDQSALVQVMAWCRQATSHHLGQCWPRMASLGLNELRMARGLPLVFQTNIWGSSSATIILSSINSEYSQTPSVRRTLVGNKRVDRSDVVGASPVGAAPTSSSHGFNGLGKDNCKTRRDEKYLSSVIRCGLYYRFDGTVSDNGHYILLWGPWDCRDWQLQ